MESARVNLIGPSMGLDTTLIDDIIGNSRFALTKRRDPAFLKTLLHPFDCGIAGTQLPTWIAFPLMVKRERVLRAVAYMPKTGLAPSFERFGYREIFPKVIQSFEYENLSEWPQYSPPITPLWKGRYRCLSAGLENICRARISVKRALR